MPDLFFYIFFFILGTIIGSFLNVLVLRYNTGVSIARGRSFCFSCGKKLGGLELIPIVSFLIQRGKCQGCKSKISWQYPIVEALTGVLFLGVFLRFHGVAGLLTDIGMVGISLILMAVLVSITVYDIKHKIIPDGLVVTFGILALIKIFFLTPEHWVWFLIAGPLLALPLFLIWLFSKGKWMGLGDPKLVLCIGWFLGPIYGLSAVVLAFWSGAIYGLILMLLSKFHWYGLKVNKKSELPFAPFLVLGLLLVFFFGFDVFGLAILM
jgi:leader peptidase (prepilin peptidase)/N-methyltransferase